MRARRLAGSAVSLGRFTEASVAPARPGPDGEPPRRAVMARGASRATHFARRRRPSIARCGAPTTQLSRRGRGARDGPESWEEAPHGAADRIGADCPLSESRRHTKQPPDKLAAPPELADRPGGLMKAFSSARASPVRYDCAVRRRAAAPRATPRSRQRRKRQADRAGGALVRSLQAL